LQELLEELYLIARRDNKVLMRINKHNNEIFREYYSINDINENILFENSIIDELLTTDKSEKGDDSIILSLFSDLTNITNLNPCFLKGYSINIFNKNITGQGNYQKCYSVVKGLFKTHKYFQNMVSKTRAVCYILILDRDCPGDAGYIQLHSDQERNTR
jgi:hypothetical protein